MYIRKFTYSAEDVDCKLCTEYARKTGCLHEVCPFLTERIEAGVVSYQSAVKAIANHEGAAISSVHESIEGAKKKILKSFAEHPKKSPPNRR